MTAPHIQITSIAAPQKGWIIGAHCTHCARTVLFWHPWAKKPDDGDYYLLKGTCVDEEMSAQHNLYPQFDFPQPRYGPNPREWTQEALANYWNPLGVPHEK